MSRSDKNVTLKKETTQKPALERTKNKKGSYNGWQSPCADFTGNSDVSEVVHNHWQLHNPSFFTHIIFYAAAPQSRTLWNINAHKLLKLKVIFKCGNYSNENKSPKTGLLSTVVAQTNATKEVGRSSVCYQPRLHETLKVNEQIKAFWPPSAVWPVRKTKLCHLIPCHDGRWVWQELRAWGWAQGWLFNSLSSLQAIPTAATQPNRNMGLGYTLVQTTDCIFHLLYIQNLKINSRFPKQLILDKKSRISC